MYEANKELSRQFTELFGSDDETPADRVFGDDVVFHGTSGDGELSGIDAVKAFVAGYRRAFPDAHSTVEDQVAEGDRVVTRWQARGSNTAGREFVMDGVTIERIADDKIVEIWVARDELGLLRQLGEVQSFSRRVLHEAVSERPLAWKTSALHRPC
jgi:predicted ester cyclase